MTRSTISPPIAYGSLALVTSYFSLLITNMMSAMSSPITSTAAVGLVAILCMISPMLSPITHHSRYAVRIGSTVATPS